MKRLFVIMAVALAAAGLQPAGAREPMVGGYTKSSVTDKGVVKAARFALTARQEALTAAGKTDKVALVRILEAAQQIVGGLNYQLKMQVKEGKIAKTVEAVIYQDLSDKYELTSWNEVAEPAKKAPAGVSVDPPMKPSVGAVAVDPALKQPVPLPPGKVATTVLIVFNGAQVDGVEGKPSNKEFRPVFEKELARLSAGVPGKPKVGIKHWWEALNMAAVEVTQGTPEMAVQLKDALAKQPYVKSAEMDKVVSISP